MGGYGEVAWPGDFWESGIPEDRDDERKNGTFRVGLAAVNSTFLEDDVCGVSNLDAQMFYAWGMQRIPTLTQVRILGCGM